MGAWFWNGLRFGVRTPRGAHPLAEPAPGALPDGATALAIASRQGVLPRLPRAFSRSIHVMVVDAGDCGACLNEIRQLNNPYYNCHRWGLFFTATPRAADVLLVVGPVSENMRRALRMTFAAMPAPKRVIAVGDCAIAGRSPFSPNFTCAGGLAEALPVDLEIPGAPPPPLAILDALLCLRERA